MDNEEKVFNEFLNCLDSKQLKLFKKWFGIWKKKALGFFK